MDSLLFILFINSSFFSLSSKNNLEEELRRKEEIEKLEASISRRKKLLSNENYVNKAPEAIVNKEREDLEKEEKRLEILKKN